MEELDQEEEQQANPSTLETLVNNIGSEAVTEPQVQKAREARDRDVALANLAQGFSQIGTSLASQGRVRPDPSVFDATRKEAETTAAETAKDVTTHRKSVFDSIKAKAAAEREKASEQFRDKSLDINQQRLDLEKQKLAAEFGPTGKKALTEGQKAVDKDYAKDYNTFTSTGKNNAEAGLSRLEAIQKELEADTDPTGTGLFESGGGRFAPITPDAFKSRDAIRRRDLARNAANQTLKSLFPGAISDAEREAAAKEYYNEGLGNAENAKILASKIAQLKGNLEAEKQKAKHYEQRGGSLQGFQPVIQKEQGPLTDAEKQRLKELRAKRGS